MMPPINLIQPIFNRKSISMTGLSHKHSTTLRRCIAPVGVASLLSLTGGWIVTQAIAPAPVHAYTGRLNVMLDVQPGESYQTLVRRAEAVARAAAQRHFDRDILITDVSIIITAQNLSRISPILTLEATRNQWRSLPDPRRWSTYYNNSKRLLGMDQAPTTTTATTPTVSSPATTIPSSPRGNSAPVVPPITAPIPLTPSAAPTQIPAGTTGASPTAPTDTAPTTQPTDRPILPDRIPTPGDIGK